MSIVISGYGGYVFKYEGDAVISLFLAEYDNVKACKNALSCSKAMLEIIREIIDPAFRANGLAEITVRIGLAYGDALVVLYVLTKNMQKAHIDIIGSSISRAAKIASIAKPNQVLIGELIYNIFLSTLSTKDLSRLREINMTLTSGTIVSISTKEVYTVYMSTYKIFNYRMPFNASRACKIIQ